MTECDFCDGDRFSKRKVEYVYQADGHFMLFKGVPCLHCDNCQEDYFEAGVLKKIEQDFIDVVVKKKKRPGQVIEVPVQDFKP